MSGDDDRTWAELVDAFHASPDRDDDQRRWPEAEDLGPDEPADEFRDASVTLGPLLGAPERVSPVEHNEHSDEHFVPPVPAPIPRGDTVSRLAWAGVISGPVALIIVTVLPWTPPEEILLLAVTGFVAGFVTLIARLRGHHPDDPDDGAVL